MKIKVTKDFFDRENDMILRKVGEEIEVSSQRGMYLQSLSLCEIISEPDETPASKPKRGKKPKE